MFTSPSSSLSALSHPLALCASSVGGKASHARSTRRNGDATVSQESWACEAGRWLRARGLHNL